ncbi:MAG: TIGR02611 family protein [Gordonia sp. (in: high G+C Gram-positive bacteria)]
MPVRQSIRIWSRQRRYVIRRDPRLNRIYRVVVGVVGTVVLLGGIVAIPYPGPGWLIVFLGLGILASEFTWAQRVLRFVRGKYDAWAEWLRRQHWAVQGAFGLVTCTVVIVSLWVFGVFGALAGWLHVDADWARSPIL